MLTRRLLCVSGIALTACGAGAQTHSVLRMTAPRATHQVVVLKDGSVLFMGGCDTGSCDTATATVDRYDPATHTISRIGNLLGPRIDGASAVLADGAVLVAGGWANGSRTNLVERFDPATGRSTGVGALTAAQDANAVQLADGRVVFMGERSVDLYDPAAGRLGKLADTSPMLDSATTTLLHDGRILVAGGGISRPPTAEAFLFDPGTGKATATGSLSTPRRKHAAVALADGRVLMIGGGGEDDRRNKYRHLEVYDPATGRFTRTGETREARFKIPDAAVLLGNGKVLVAGGAAWPELIDPNTWSVRRVDVELGATLNFSVAVRLSNGDVLVAGGYGEQTIKPTDSVWIIPASKLA